MAFWGKKEKAETKDSAQAPAAPQAAAPPPPSSAAAAPTKERQNAASQPRPQSTQPQLMAKLGEIVSILMRSPQHRGMQLAQIEALVMPPLLAGQYVVAGAAAAENGASVPVAVALWARVSLKVDQRLSSNLEAPMQIVPQEWTSGNIAWLIALVGPEKIISPLLSAVQKSALGGQTLKMRARDKDGKNIVGTFTGT